MGCERLGPVHAVRVTGARDRATPGVDGVVEASSDHVCHAEVTRAACGGTEVSLDHVDRLIGELAVGQDAVVTFLQLRTLGLGRGAIAHRCCRGALVAMHVGVYRWGPIETSRTRVRAAVLACGAQAFASHHAALGLYGVRPLPTGSVDVTVVRRRVRQRGVRSHRTRTLHDADRRLLRGIPVTSPARALLEVAAELTPRELADAVEQAQIKRLVTKREILATITRSPRRPGVAALRELAEDQAFTRSRAERLLVALLRKAVLPEPVFNAYLDGWEIDALWQRERVALEFDSYGFHATRAAFERDRRKTAALTRSGYLVLRTTWTELTKQPYALIARTAEALALSAGAPTASPARAGP